MLAQRKKTINHYFSAFNAKNIDVLQKLLDDNVLLEDWEGKYDGISDVLCAAKNLFKEFPKLKIKILNLACEREFCCAEIYIQLNKDLMLKVVDVFYFECDKIKEIRAYRQ